MCACPGRKIEHGTTQDCVCGTIRRENEADRFERFTDDERDAMLGRFQEKVAVNGRREAGDNNGRHILQRKFLFTFRCFAGQLAVFATKRALRRVYADDVVGHELISNLRFHISNPRLAIHEPVAGLAPLSRWFRWVWKRHRFEVFLEHLSERFRALLLFRAIARGRGQSALAFNGRILKFRCPRPQLP